MQYTVSPLQKGLYNTKCTCMYMLTSFVKLVYYCLIESRALAEKWHVTLCVARHFHDISTAIIFTLRIIGLTCRLWNETCPIAHQRPGRSVQVRYQDLASHSEALIVSTSCKPISVRL